MVENINTCFGCGSCTVSCCHDAIELSLDKDGFWSPIVNKDKCIRCGFCLKNCPSAQFDFLKLSRIGEDSTLYAVQSIPEDNETSSGGISYALAKNAILEKMPVCAVAYNNIKDIAEHIVVQSFEQLKDIKGSKYIASNTQSGFNKIIKMGKGVIFGTPCQIVGLDLLLRNKGLRNRFLLVDIFCHGVPSQLLWKNHIKWIRDKYNVQADSKISFRNKGIFRIKAGSYDKTAQVDAFYYFYLRELVNRESCYNCPFRRKTSADLRMGDYFDEQSGNWSLLFINSDYGLQKITEIKEQIRIRNASYYVMNSAQDNEIKKDIPSQRKKFMSRLRNGSSPSSILGVHNIALQYFKGSVKRIFNK